MCHRLCLVLLAVAQALRGRLTESPLEELREDASGSKFSRMNVAWAPELVELIRGNSSEAVEILRGLAKDKEWEVRRIVAASSPLKALVETRPQEGAQVMKELAKDEESKVRIRLAEKQTLKLLLKARPEEGAEAVMNLLEKDPEVRIRKTKFPFWRAFKKYATLLKDSVTRTLEQDSSEEKVSAATSSSLRAVMHLNFTEGEQLFAKLIADPDPEVREAAVECPAWSALFAFNVTKGLRLFKTLSRSFIWDAAAARA